LADFSGKIMRQNKIDLDDPDMAIRQPRGKRSGQGACLSKPAQEAQA